MKNLIAGTTLSLVLILCGCGGDKPSSSSPTEDIPAQNTPSQTSQSISPDAVNSAGQEQINSVPEAEDKSFELGSSGVVSGKLDATDADGDKLSFKVVNPPANGALVLKSDGSFTYKAKNGSVESDSFTFVVSDDISSCKPKKVTIKRVVKQESIPAAPSNLTLEAVSSCRIRVAWSDNSDNEKGFVIRRNGELVTVTKSNVETIDFCSGLKPATTYKISVSAQNSAGESSAIEGYVTTPKLLTAPEAPSELRAVAVSENMVRLSWSDNADNETAYEIYMDGKWIKSLDADSNCFVVDGLESGSRYTFHVEAKNSIGSTNSNIIVITTKEKKQESSDNRTDETGSDSTTQDDTQNGSTNDQNSSSVSDENSTTVENETDDNASNSDNNTSTTDQNSDQNSSSGDSNTTDDTSEQNSTGSTNESGDDNTTTPEDSNASQTDNGDNNSTTTPSDTNTTDNNNTTDETNTTDDSNSTETKTPKSYDGPFGDIKTLLQKAKTGEIDGVTYISVGDSTRANDPHYNNGEIFEIVSTKLDEYGVNSILQAQAGHSARRWNNYEDAGTLAGYPTWEDTVAQIPDDGNTTILNISLGINDARYTGSQEKETILFHLGQAIDKVLEAKPNTHIILTMPNKMVGKEENDGDNHDLDHESKEVYDAYMELAQNYPMIDVMDELFGGETDMSMYRAADEEEYGEGVGIHLSSKGQKAVADLILKTILPD